MSEYTQEEIIEKIRRNEKEFLELKGVDLVRADFREVNLAGVNLSEVNLRGSNLRGANLDQANFFRANMEGVDLRGANLRGASLREAKLWGANLGISNLIGASMRGVMLDGANLVGANLDGASLVEADLKGADLRGVSLRGVELKGAKLWGANLWEADLRGADIRGAELGSAILNQADLRGANITGANIWGIICKGWKIEGLDAEYVYNCATPWVKGSKEKTKQNFEPGEFEKNCKSLPTVELLFLEGISSLDYIKLLGLVEIIRQERPEINLGLKSFEKIGKGTILRFTLSRDDCLEEAVRLIVQSCRGQGLSHKLPSLLEQEYGIHMEFGLGQQIFTEYDISKVVINALKQTGESWWKSEMGEIDIGEPEPLPKDVVITPGKVVDYKVRQAAVDALLVEGDEARQDLAETLVNVLRAKRKKKSPETWS